MIDALLSARVYDLEQPRYAGAPIHPVHEPGVLLALHRRHERGTPEPRTGASAMLVMAEHSGTHIDAHLAWDLMDDRDLDLGSLPGHTILIVQEGIHIIESLFLEELAHDRVREFGFVCLPLKLRGGTGSPVRPIALA